MSEHKHYHVLNLGAGVQSTTLQLLANESRLLDESGQPIKFDCSIFGDTQEEPTDTGENVYNESDLLSKGFTRQPNGELK